ncbi:unnamed protein product [Pleuronectes platessa]|uniref:Uncharacterized protein n=1 Tax=Pleuronectes platessa TaxID=8262 RepID=A0A9N7YXK6_PLEPL|nr:unnamed protein product [Pleuronectes platessa]
MNLNWETAVRRSVGDSRQLDCIWGQIGTSHVFGLARSCAVEENSRGCGEKKEVAPKIKHLPLNLSAADSALQRLIQLTLQGHTADVGNRKRKTDFGQQMDMHSTKLSC